MLIDIFNKKADDLVKKSTFDNVWRIQIDNSYITTPSNKTVWKKEAHAKNALRYAMHVALDEARDSIQEYYPQYTYRECLEIVEIEYNNFIKNRVKFVHI